MFGRVLVSIFWRTWTMEQRPDVTRNKKPLPAKTQNVLLIGFCTMVIVAVFAAVAAV